jgi:hypothetical protein
MSRKSPASAAPRAASAPRARNVPCDRPAHGIRRVSVLYTVSQTYYSFSAMAAAPARPHLLPSSSGYLCWLTAWKLTFNTYGARMRRVRMLPIRCSASLSSYPCVATHWQDRNGSSRAGRPVLEPTKRRPPLLFSVVQLLAARWAAEGRRDLAIAALLGFECYFRPRRSFVASSSLTSPGTAPYATTRSSSVLLRFVRPKRALTWKSSSGLTTLLRFSGSTSLSVLANRAPLPMQGGSTLHFHRRSTISARSSSERLQAWVWHTCSLRRIAFATVAQPATES